MSAPLDLATPSPAGPDSSQDSSQDSSLDSSRDRLRIAFQNTYARLPAPFHARVNPTLVAAPRLLKLNVELAKALGLDAEALSSPEGVEFLAGNHLAAGSEPMALAYAGHQFGHFVPQLGDGRANLLGEVIGVNGLRYDIQLKGSGPTPFSRRGDGRAALGPVLREYIVSEAMAAFGVPTTRALAAVTTGEKVFRETVMPGAVFTRVAASHLRVGTFQYFAARGDTESLRTLADYAIARHYPQITLAASAERPYRALLEAVVTRQANLIAQWMLIGFIHGVMNTDNMSISGETLDYGPCAFMEAYDPATVFSSIDHGGRYAYANQPHAAHWNLSRLAEAMLPLLETEEGSQPAAIASAQEALATFDTTFETALNAGLHLKIGLSTESSGDAELIADFLERMAAHRADFTLTFRRLCEAAADPARDKAVRALFTDPFAYDAWAVRWRLRIAQESLTPQARAASMRSVNPAFIPRNHLVQAALEAAISQGNLQPFEQLLQVLAKPYDDREDAELYSTPATPAQYVHATFCGT